MPDHLAHLLPGVFLSAFMLCGQSVAAPFASVREIAVDVGCQDPQVSTVIGKGSGLDPSSAEKDALRDAVEQAVGLLLDAETQMENEEVVEKILTYSGAYIEKYDTISTKKGDSGLFRCKVRAVVKKTQLHEKLVEEKLIRKKISGKSLFAKARSKLEEKSSSAPIFRKAFEGFPLGVLKASVEGEPDTLYEKDHVVGLGIKVRFEYDQEAWAGWAETLERLLKPIAREVGTYRPKQSGNNAERMNRSIDQLRARFKYNITWKNPSRRSLTETFGDPMKDRKNFIFFVADRAGSGQVWRWYKLSRDPLLGEIYRPMLRYPEVNISIVDGNGSSLAASTFDCASTWKGSEGYMGALGPFGHYWRSRDGSYLRDLQANSFQEDWVKSSSAQTTQFHLSGVQFITCTPGFAANNGGFCAESFVAGYVLEVPMSALEKAENIEVRLTQRPYPTGGGAYKLGPSSTISYTTLYNGQDRIKVPLEIKDSKK